MPPAMIASTEAEVKFVKRLKEVFPNTRILATNTALENSPPVVEKLLAP